MNRYVTDIERLKRLAPVMERCGVEANMLAPASTLVEYGGDSTMVSHTVGTYDYAALESVLPDWVFGYCDRNTKSCELYDIYHDFMDSIQNEDLYWEIENILFDIFSNRDEVKLNAMCDLILLLDENNVKLRSVL